jgi:hypothetical protein
MLFSYCDHLSYAAYVLRVLSQETLETNKEVKDPFVPGPSVSKEVKDPFVPGPSMSKEVKDPFVPGPSMSKEVKDSSLTILSNLDPFQKSFVQARHNCRVFPVDRAH